MSFSLNAKATQRPETTPSPQPDNVLNVLFQIKDSVNSKLLEETKKSVDLANVLSMFEDQLRDAVENTLKDVKTELDKRRRKQAPGIKRLEDTCKGLVKSETKINRTEKHFKNADLKKAKHRIKDARRILQEHLSLNMELGIHSYIADQVTILCQRLMRIPVSIKPSDSQLLSNKATVERGKISDSDSDLSVECLVRVPHMGSAETKEVRNRSRKHERNSEMFKQRLTSTAKKNSTLVNTSATKHLNGVDLFSSDSDTYEEPFDTKSYMPIQMHGHREYTVLMKPEHTLNETDKYESSPTKYVKENDTLSLHKRHDFSDDETTHYSEIRDSPTFFNTGDQNKNRSVNVKQNDEHGPSFSESTKIHVKRLLPVIPKRDPNVKQNGVSNTVQNTNAERFSDFNEFIDGEIKPDTSESNKHDSSDIDEIKFKESVRTARIEIIDKIKSKYNITHVRYNVNGVEDTTKTQTAVEIMTHSVPEAPTDIRKCKSSSELDKRPMVSVLDKSKYSPNQTNEKQMNIYQPSNACSMDFKRRAGYSLPSNEYRDEQSILETNTDSFPKQNRINLRDSPVYRGKLVEIRDETKCHQDTNYDRKNEVYSHVEKVGTVTTDLASTSHSIVGQAISKFETKIKGDLSPNKTVPKLKNGISLSYKEKYRSRSTSGTRTYYSPEKEKTSSSHISNRALRPRIHSDNQNGAMNPESSEPLYSVCSPVKPPFCKHRTETDLDALCSNETTSSIRHKWRQRRSTSLTLRTQETAVKVASSFEYNSSFYMPDQQETPSHASSIVILTDGSIVILDEMHCCLHLFSKYYVHKKQLNVLEVPGRVVNVDERKIGVAFPYKSKIVFYEVRNDAFEYDKEIKISCPEWVTDIGFAKQLLYALCKGGDIHLLSIDGVEQRRLAVGMTGKLLVHPSGRRFYITGEGRVTRFDENGTLVSSKTDIIAYSVVLINDRLYVADRRKHRIAPLANFPVVDTLIEGTIEYPSAVAVCKKDDILLISQFEENMDIKTTRKILVYQLRKA